MDQPCLALQQGGVLHLCDPTQKGGVVGITLGMTLGGGPAVQVILPPGGAASEPAH